ncbi:MAG: leucine-rich repeat domain-containing protein [Prevotella sp.]|jgi:hypothetical protein
MNKKDILDKLSKLSKKGTKFESLVINRVLQRLDTEDFLIGDKAVYTADHKRLIYVSGDTPEISIEEGVEVIGEMAVAKKKNLKTITFPTSLKKIERDAFTNCGALESIHIPASVKEIEAYAFSDCDGLKDVYFEDIPKNLHRKAFADCDQLHKISVPAEGVKTIRKALHIVDGDADYLVVGREDPNKPNVDKQKKNDKKEKEKEPNSAKITTKEKKTSKTKDNPIPKESGENANEKETGNKKTSI